nr:uncharacterized protein LOC128680608 [Plodia interpunctella]
MNCQLLYILTQVWLFHSTLCMIGRVFEFLDDEANSRLIMATHGNKAKDVQSLTTKISVPKCIEVTYVRVVISSVEPLPYVSYDEKTHLVNITYDREQNTDTLFQIFAKGGPDRYCGSKKKLKGPGYKVSGSMVRFINLNSVKIPESYIRYP